MISSGAAACRLTRAIKFPEAHDTEASAVLRSENSARISCFPRYLFCLGVNLDWMLLPETFPGAPWCLGTQKAYSIFHWQRKGTQRISQSPAWLQWRMRKRGVMSSPKVHFVSASSHGLVCLTQISKLLVRAQIDSSQAVWGKLIWHFQRKKQAHEMPTKSSENKSKAAALNGCGSAEPRGISHGWAIRMPVQPRCHGP